MNPTSDNRLTWSIKGLADVRKRMKALPEKLQERGMKAALRAGAEKIAEAARSNASNIDDPATDESVEANITVSYSTKGSRKDQRMMYRVGVRGGAKQGAGSGGPGGDTWYWRLVEFGTSHSGAKPFMRPAMESQAAAASEEVATRLERFLDRAAKAAAQG